MVILKKHTELELFKLAELVQKDLAVEIDDVERELNYLNSISDIVYRNGKARILE